MEDEIDAHFRALEYLENDLNYVKFLLTDKQWNLDAVISL
jgi:hypothetical protein